MGVLSSLGTEVKTTTAFHPQSNGMVERFHRTLKASLMARLDKSSDWLEELPAVLLGIRAAFREEFGTSIAEVVLGQELGVPGQLLVKEKALNSPSGTHPFFRKIDELLESRKSVPRHGLRQSRSNNDLWSAEHAFVWDDSVKKLLVRPYKGPFRVLAKFADYFEILVCGHLDTVSVDRPKPAFGSEL